MDSFGYGGRIVSASSAEEGLAIVRELDRLDWRRNRIKMLQSVNHGHDFGHNWFCPCGMPEKDYRFYFREDLEQCPLKQS